MSVVSCLWLSAWLDGFTPQVFSLWSPHGSWQLDPEAIPLIPRHTAQNDAQGSEQGMAIAGADFAAGAFGLQTPRGPSGRRAGRRFRSRRVSLGNWRCFVDDLLNGVSTSAALAGVAEAGIDLTDARPNHTRQGADLTLAEHVT